MDIEQKGKILAIVVLAGARNKVKPGGAPIFIAENEEEQEKIALNLSRTLKAMAHDLENGVYILMKH